ncbi:MAG: serine/threonine-protein kinase, partial [Planctomycetota bacterium]|nr:serine/threonine-protein kinase [Planctomycetota bacterium]
GAMGTVFKARQRKLGRIVALKVLRPSLARDGHYVERLKREARIVAALNHPNIVAGYDLGEENGYHYFVMEFVEGKSLRALLGEWGIFSEDRVLDVATQVASALDHAFECGVIHRDIKPGNILIDETGAVKLTDMGLAKGPADMALTRDGATVGTPQYISPEQAKNPQDVDVRGDLYSLGATLYHMATGQPPFPGDSMAEVITKVLSETPQPPGELNPELGEGLALVIRKLMAKNLRVRYQKPRELLDDLERVRQDQPPKVDASRLSVEELDEAPKVWLWTLLTLGGAALVLLAVWLGMQMRSDTNRPDASNEYVAQLESDLQGLATLSERLGRLRAAALAPPPGQALAIERLLRGVSQDLQREVDELAGELGNTGWPGLQGWLVEPGGWPSLADVEARFDRQLFERTGLTRQQLPSRVSTLALDEVLERARRAVQRRDQSLVSQFRHHVEVTLPSRADERLRSGDFRGAERVWRNGRSSFFDGRRQPVPEAVEATQREQQDRLFGEARDLGLQRVDLAEKNLGSALRQEAEDGLADLRVELANDAAAAALEGGLARLREALRRAYPSTARFRPAADPWPAVESELSGFERAVDMRASEQARARASAVIDLAWRAFCSGDAQAGLMVLGEPNAEPGDNEALIEGHRRVLRAASTVKDAMLRALQGNAHAFPGYPRNGAATMELRVLGDQVPRLYARPPGGELRPARITEFLFEDLWQRAFAAGPEVMAAVPAAQLDLGRSVLALVGDDLMALPDSRANIDSFVLDEIWPRIVRVRTESGPQVIDRAVAYKRLHEAWERARGGAMPRELRAALAQWKARFAADASPAEQDAQAYIEAWLDRADHRLAKLKQLEQRAPSGAKVDLTDDGEQLHAEVLLGATELQRGAADGWEIRGGLLEFAGGVQSVADMKRRALRVNAGLPSAVGRSRLRLVAALPSSDHGERIYVLTFRGVSMVLVADAGDRVCAAVVRGNPQRRDRLHAAVRQALLRSINDDASETGLLLAGALQRITIQVDPVPVGARARVQLLFERRVLCDELVSLNRSDAPDFELYPLQDLAVNRVEVGAELGR